MLISNIEKLFDSFGSSRAHTKDNQSFPDSLSKTHIICESIGGTTGALLIEDDDSKSQYVQKSSSSKLHFDHLFSEYYASRIYQVLQIPAPKTAIYDLDSQKQIEKTASKTNVVLLSKFISGDIAVLGEYLEEQQGRLKEVQQMVKQGFVADCLLANWDVAGADFDNLLIDRKTKIIWRVDHGGALEYRAQGLKKGPKFFTPYVQELTTLRNPEINPNTAMLYQNITDIEIVEQIEFIFSKKDGVLNVLPEHLKPIMARRIDYLFDYAKRLKEKM